MEKHVIPPKFSAVLRNRSFMFLWTAQMLSQLADRVYIYVLVLAAYNLTHTNLGVSVPMLSFGIPSVLFASFAGVYVDRWNKKYVMFFSCFLRAAVIFAIAFLLESSLLWIFLVSLGVYTIAQFFAPAEASSLAEIVERENLILANSLFVTTWMWTSVAAFGLGALLVGFFGNEKTLMISSALYLLSSVAILLVSIKHSNLNAGSSVKTVKQDLLKGLEFIRRKAVIRYAFFKMFMVTSALSVVSMLAIQFAEKYIGIGAKNFGYLVILAGGGMIFGMWALGGLSHYFKKNYIVFAGFFMTGSCLVLLSQTKNLYLAFFYCFVLGFGNILINATVQTVIAHKTPRSLRGRIFGIQNMLINFAFTIPVVAFGMIADSFGLDTSILLLGLMLYLPAVMVLFEAKET
ncbi:MAG: MFS transporter [Candidatus Margulisiibacteriota bacterium]